MGIVGDIRDASIHDVVPEKQFESYEVQGGDFEGVDEVKKPVENGNKSFGEQDQISAGYSGDGAACANDGAAAYEGMSYCACDGPSEIKQQVAEVSELVVDIVAEKIKEEHITEYVHRAAVQEGVGNKLPEVWFDGSEHKSLKKFFAACGQQVRGGENDGIYGDECVIYVGCPPRTNTRSNWQ